jgi:Outer membrane protein beta-barrel domain
LGFLRFKSSQLAGLVRCAKPLSQATACFAALAGIGFSPASRADEPGSAEIGVSYLSFRYAEFPDNQRLRNRETGFVPGVHAGLRFAPGAWRIALAGSAHQGNVDYDGATSSFRPHQTQTNTTILNGAATIGYAYAATRTLTLSPYLGAGYRYWRRDIQPNNGVLGLLENYRWFYGVVGVEGTLKTSDRFSVGADVRVIRPFDAKLDVKINPETTLDLAPHTGYRLALPMRWSFGGRFGVALEPYYERQEFGASAPKNRLLEPASDSDIFGLSVSGRISF